MTRFSNTPPGKNTDGNYSLRGDGHSTGHGAPSTTDPFSHCYRAYGMPPPSLRCRWAATQRWTDKHHLQLRLNGKHESFKTPEDKSARLNEKDGEELRSFLTSAGVTAKMANAD